MTTTTAALGRTPQTRKAGFGHLLLAEWTKIRSVRYDRAKQLRGRAAAVIGGADGAQGRFADAIAAAAISQQGAKAIGAAARAVFTHSEAVGTGARDTNDACLAAKGAGPGGGGIFIYLHANAARDGFQA